MMLVLLFCSFSCQKEDHVLTNEETSNEVQNVISRKLSFEELPHKVQVKKVLDNLNETFTASSDVMQRGIEPDSVSILADNVLYMTYAETHTYTFTLIRNNPEYYIENIVLHYNLNTNSYDEYLVQYTLTGNDFIDVYNGAPLKENNSSKITKLDNGYFGNLMNRGGFCTQNCTTFYFNCTACYCHEYGDVCDGAPDQQPFFIEICGEPNCYDTNPETSIDDGDSGGGGSGGGDPGDSDIVTNPNPTEPCQDSSGQVGITDSSGCTPVNEATQDQKNCEQLNILGSNQKIKESFQDLQSKAADAFITREYGYKFTQSSDPEHLELGNDLNQIIPQYGGQIYGMSHTHPVKFPGVNGAKIIPMFSAEDLYNLAMLTTQFSNNPKPFELFVITLTVKTDNGGTETFALKINNWLAFSNWANTFGYDATERKSQINILKENYAKIMNGNGGNIPENYLETFLQFLNDTQINGSEQYNYTDGIDLYQATDTNLNNWKRLKLKNGSITEENC